VVLQGCGYRGIIFLSISVFIRARQFLTRGKKTGQEDRIDRAGGKYGYY
jgi:hypothetical protein